MAILFSEVFDTSPNEFTLDAVLNSDSAQVGNTFKALRKLLSVSERDDETLKKGSKPGEDFEMFDETQGKNGSQAQKFSEEIANSLTQLMTKFVSAFKQIQQSKQGELASSFFSAFLSSNPFYNNK